MCTYGLQRLASSFLLLPLFCQLLFSQAYFVWILVVMLWLLLFVACDFSYTLCAHTIHTYVCTYAQAAVPLENSFKLKCSENVIVLFHYFNGHHSVNSWSSSSASAQCPPKPAVICLKKMLVLGALACMHTYLCTSVGLWVAEIWAALAYSPAAAVVSATFAFANLRKCQFGSLRSLWLGLLRPALRWILSVYCCCCCRCRYCCCVTEFLGQQNVAVKVNGICLWHIWQFWPNYYYTPADTHTHTYTLT